MDNFCKTVLESVLDIKAEKTVVIDISKVSLMADYMIVCTGRSSSHTQGIANNILEKAKENNFKVYSIEGLNDGNWILIDLGNALIHIMTEETREYYKIEKLWSNGNTLYSEINEVKELKNV
ncbi:MAG: ribosome silencing factor [Candidatus Sericytochromatia bacterium]